jgi:galactoside 3-L-fucosyltransferase 11
VSNVSKGRLAYVQELMKYIKVDSFGKCLHNVNSSYFGRDVGYKVQVLSHYKFYLAFEVLYRQYMLTIIRITT